ncbi:hypothetical protein JCM13664_20190 [Methylothermus subterraneus]
MSKGEFQKIAQLNAKLLQAAAMANWPRVRVLEAERRRLLRRCLEALPEPDFLGCLQGVVQTDRKLIRLRLASPGRARTVRCGGE